MIIWNKEGKIISENEFTKDSSFDEIMDFLDGRDDGPFINDNYSKEEIEEFFKGIDYERR